MHAPGWFTVLLIVVLVSSSLLAACSVSTNDANPGSTPAVIPNSSSRALGGTVLPASLAAPWAERAGFVSNWTSTVSSVTPMANVITVSLSLWPSNTSLFATPAPATPLSEAQFERQYSPSVAQYAALEQYFTGHGVAIEHTFADRLALTVEGPAGTLGALFGTTIEQGTYEGGAVHFPTSVPSLPPALAPFISSVSGLSDGFARFSMPVNVLPLDRGTAGSARPAQSPDLITPGIVRQIYDTSTLYNLSGQTRYASGVGIALVLWGDGYNPNDLNTFYSQDYPSEFPAPKIIPVPVDQSVQPAPNATADPSLAPLELTLDLEWSGSQAPGATLYAVYAPDGPASDQYSPSDATLEDALNQALQEPGVEVVSMSFATADGSDPSFQAAFTTSFEHAQAIGVTVVAASGDNGGTNNPKGACTSTPQPEFPAASPEVLAVGGTNPALSTGLTGQITGMSGESVWPDSGGGFSNDYAAPSWQLVGSAGSVIGPDGHRGIPDIAAPATYNFLYYNSQPGAGNGTSFAAPTIGGIIAEMDAIRGTSFGLIAPRLYALGAAEPDGTEAPALVPVTTGGNCIGTASTGWDTATGWGSPRADLLYDDLSYSYVLLNLSTSSSDVAPGSSVSAIISIENASSHQPIVGVPVNLTLSAPGYAGPCGGTLATGTGTTNGSGETLVALGLPGCFLGTHATISATVQARGLFGSASATVSVNLFGVAGFLAVLETYPYNVVAFAIILAVATVGGWSLGNWRHKRRLRRAGGAIPAAGASAPSPAPGAPPPPLPGASMAGTAVAPPTAALGAAPATAAPSAPPPAPRPEATAAGSSVSIIKCSACGLRFSPDLGFCPRCGQWVPGSTPPAGGPFPPPPPPLPPPTG
jgi:Subtilase family/Pro-kumamolisin, activation domain